MPQPIVYIDKSRILAGKLEELKAAMNRLIAFVENEVPQVLSYGFFLTAAETQLTVVAVHPDSASLEYHMDVGAPEFRQFAELIELQSIDVYGEISDGALERLHKKAQLLGQGPVVVHECYAGFTRWY